MVRAIIETMVVKAVEMGSRVLVPVDNQECSEAALLSVMSRVWEPDTSFLLCKVVEDFRAILGEAQVEHESALSAEQEEYRYNAGLWLKQTTRAFAEVLPRVEACLEFGPVVEKLSDVAYSWGADYIVLGSQDLGLSTRCALGSVASSLLRQAPCTVEAVRSSRLKHLLHAQGNVSTHEIGQIISAPPRKIIIATDLSSGADAAAEWVAEMNWSPDAEFLVATVNTPSHKDSHSHLLSMGAAYTREKYHLLQVESLLKNHAGRIVEAFGLKRVEADIITDESPANGILTLANDWQADLVVTGSRGANRNPDFRAGNTAVGILDRVHCSAIAVQMDAKKQVKFHWSQSEAAKK